MAAEHIQIKSPIRISYFKGNIVAVYNYNHKTFRYNLLKIDEALFLPKLKALKVAPDVYDAQHEVNR